MGNRFRQPLTCTVADIRVDTVAGLARAFGHLILDAVSASEPSANPFMEECSV
jgi:hypothetical protein